jgi:SpoVK/Ycf46/Vps4 family AAA+-type ATPase
MSGQKLLADMELAPDFPLRALAESTPTLSGSDLKELCRSAALLSMREGFAALHTSGADLSLMSTAVRVFSPDVGLHLTLSCL